MSRRSLSFRPGAALPVVIRTRAISGWSNTIPKNERLPSPGDAGTNPLKSSRPLAAKLLDDRARPTIPPRPVLTVLPVDVCKDGTECPHLRGSSTVSAGYKKSALSNVASDWSEQSQWAEDGKNVVTIGWIVEEAYETSLGSARWRRLRKTRSQSGEPCATCVQEDVERCDRRSGSIDVTAAIPVDFAATDCERSRIVGVVGFTELSAKRIHHALKSLQHLVQGPHLVRRLER
jgi:hypothetical protein